MNRYRHEYKYIIDACQEQQLKVTLNGLLEKDAHVGEDGCYSIHSLYFDDLYNTCFYENENGTDPRAKYRIRYYNDDIERLTLEKKIKNHGMTLKHSCRISMDECRMMMRGNIPDVNESMEERKKQLLTEMRMKKMQPKVVVSYERIPYVHPIGNVRVTIDRNISASDEVESFMDGNFRQRPIMPSGRQVLEVKWDELLPSYIKNCLQIETLQWSAFSKYYLSRKYSTSGGLK